MLIRTITIINITLYVMWCVLQICGVTSVEELLQKIVSRFQTRETSISVKHFMTKMFMMCVGMNSNNLANIY